MFYPVESLKRGGRFYLCWVADSWPLRFATITHRQLWSQDIRQICDALLEVMTNESGRPTRRFSLRLSSQLMRGLVRLYQRKVIVFLGELCMLNATVTKHVNKKFVYQQEAIPAAGTLPRVEPELSENEERVEEIIQRSGNVVVNIEDITLKESALPEVHLMVNDNFGELHPDQPLQMLADKTLEMMMAHDLSVPQQSLELPLDFSTDKSHDKSRLAAHDPQMERISEHDLTLFAKSAAGDDLIVDVTKEIPGIPEFPEISHPAPPQSHTEVEREHPEKAIEIDQEIPQGAVVGNRRQEPEEIVLEELEDPQPPAKRRRVRNKIIDKNIKLTSNYLRARIENCAVELRCEDASEDIVKIRVPYHILLGRAAHAGHRVGSALGHTIARLFLRNLGPVNKCPLADREMEGVLAQRVDRRARSVLEKIDEEVEPRLPTVDPQQTEPQERMSVEPITDRTAPEITVPEDIADLPTQVIETLSQQARKRTAEREVEGSPKAPRRSGYKSFRKSQQGSLPALNIEADPNYEVNKENIPDNVLRARRPSTDADGGLVTLTSMLQEAGLADLPTRMEPEVFSPKALQRARKTGSEGTETPLGSLDRTKVSLGDSDKTTDSIQFIRDHWGTEGTMVKIIKCVKNGIKPLDVRALVASGPAVTGLKHIVIARCFTSILKLKQHRFIDVLKDPETLEIRDITMGPKFEAV